MRKKSKIKVFELIYQGEDMGTLKKGMPMRLYFDREHIKKIYHAHRAEMILMYTRRDGTIYDVSFIEFMRKYINKAQYEGRTLI